MFIFQKIIEKKSEKSANNILINCRNRIQLSIQQFSHRKNLFKINENPLQFVNA